MSLAPMRAMSTESTNAPLGELLGKRRRRSRRPLIAIAALAVAGVAAWQLVTRLSARAAEPTYSTATVSRADVVDQVTATGTLSPVIQVEVGSQVSGRIVELGADYNTAVNKGDVIARLDPLGFETNVAQARAKLTASYAELTRTKAVAANARTNYERLRNLAEAGVVATAEVDEALAAKQSADAQVSSAQAAITVAKTTLSQAELDLGYTTITSPIDGVIVSRSVDVGQTVAASLSAPTLFVIAGDLREMEVHTSVSEGDVGKLSEGMMVEFTVDAYPDKRFAGTVKQVRYEATTVSNVVTYDAVVSVRNETLELRPGMTANVSFVVSAARDTLAVSNKALRFRPADAQRATDQRGPGVWVLRDGELVRVPVELGLSDGSSTAIASAELAEGDVVIVGDGSAGAGQVDGAKSNGGRTGRRGPPSIL